MRLIHEKPPTSHICLQFIENDISERDAHFLKIPPKILFISNIYVYGSKNEKNQNKRVELSGLGKEVEKCEKNI